MKAGGDVEFFFGGAKPLGDDRQAAIVGGAGGGGDAVGDFALEHQGHAVEQPDIFQPADQQRRCDIVGQVGDEGNFFKSCVFLGLTLLPVILCKPKHL